MNADAIDLESAKQPVAYEQLAHGALRFITCGSVDDGKSTLIGRLLYDAKHLADDQRSLLDSRRDAEGIDFASLVDGLEAEREQGITIDVAYRYFQTAKRRFIIADTPGHEQYTRNMATGASTADLAVVLVDATKGILPQTLRHSLIVSLMGIRHVVLAVNKMDLVDFDEARFGELVAEYTKMAARFGFRSVVTIPLAAKWGDNVVERSARMPWYEGLPLLASLEDAVIESERLALRFPVQWVNRPNQHFRGYAGTLAGGQLRVGDPICNPRSGALARVARIVTMGGDRAEAVAGDAVTLTLAPEIDVSRGDILCDPRNRPAIAQQLSADLVWMSSKPLIPGRQYIVVLGRQEAIGSVLELRYKLDVNTGEHLAATTLELNDIGQVDLDMTSPLMFDPYAENRLTGAFILIDRLTNETAGAGTIRFALRRALNVHLQDLTVTKAARARSLGQRPRVIWFTGLSGAGKSTIADLVEQKLHAKGRHTYILDGDNVRHGINKDLGFTDADRVENIRRVAEIAKLMADAGLIVLVAFISPFRAERQMARELIADDFVEVHVATPLGVAETRDVKGLYAKARRGELKNFTGIDSPYEEPLSPELVLDTTAFDAGELADQVLAAIGNGDAMEAVRKI